MQHFFEYVVESVSKLKQCGLKAQIAIFDTPSFSYMVDIAQLFPI